MYTNENQASGAYLCVFVSICGQPLSRIRATCYTTLMQRRTFLGAAAAAAGSTRELIGANDRVTVGLIGCGGRGRYVANFMRQAC